MDWQLAVDLIQVLSNPAYSAGADGNFTSSISLSNWQPTAVRLRDDFCSFFTDATPDDSAALPALTIGNEKYAIAHPFWSSTGPAGSLVEQSTNSLGEVRLIDTFNLSKRMAWCRKNLREFPLAFPNAAPQPTQSNGITFAAMLGLSPNAEFQLAQRPKGLAARYSTKFVKGQFGAPSSRKTYLVIRPTDGEIVAGRVQSQDGGFTFISGNHKDRVSQFHFYDAASIVAEYKG